MDDLRLTEMKKLFGSLKKSLLLRLVHTVPIHK